MIINLNFKKYIKIQSYIYNNFYLKLLLYNIFIMNKKNKKYDDYLKISNNWPLDDWSITKECFDNIVDILPFGSSILEIGSGNSTLLLSKFYKMISVESNKQWLNKFDSKYYYIEEQEIESKEFGKTLWLNPQKVLDMLKEINYDLLIVDAGGRRVGIYDYIDYFKKIYQ